MRSFTRSGMAGDQRPPGAPRLQATFVHPYEAALLELEARAASAIQAANIVDMVHVEADYSEKVKQGWFKPGVAKWCPPNITAVRAEVAKLVASGRG